MTTPRHYPSSAPGRIAEFFRDNPDEELLQDDLYTKFGGEKNTVRMAVARLISEGLIESVRVIRVKRGGAQ